MVAEVRDPLKCGNCGNDTCVVFHVVPEGAGRVGGGPSFAGYLELVCRGCGGVTEIRPAAPRLVAVEAARSAVSGSLCGGWR